MPLKMTDFTQVALSEKHQGIQSMQNKWLTLVDKKEQIKKIFTFVQGISSSFITLAHGLWRKIK